MEGNLLQVSMRTGESLFAPIVPTGVGVAIPSKKWISDNKDKFLALVTFEKNLLDNPMIIGFYPVKGADSKAYDITERLIEALLELLDGLSSAKTNTSIGPQPFMPETITKLKEITTEIKKIKELVLPLKL